MGWTLLGHDEPKSMGNASHLRETRRKHLEARTNATCDISDLLRRAQHKLETNIFHLDWVNCPENEILTIGEGCYSILEKISSYIVLTPAKTDVTSETNDISEAWFNERADRWEREAGIHSSPAARFIQKDYISIMAKGQKVAPFIFKRLATSKKDWCWALERIFDPVNPGEGINNYTGKVNAWLKWGESKNLI